MGVAQLSNKFKCAPLTRAMDVSAYPPYYSRDLIATDVDVRIASETWAIIFEKSTVTTAFLTAKNNDDFRHTSLLSWFYSLFYERFFQLAPDAIPVFSSIGEDILEKLVSKLVSCTLSVLRDPIGVRKNLLSLSRLHKEKGVKVEHYGSMGASLFWAIKAVLGERYDSTVKKAWKNLFCHLLSIIIPLALSL